MSVEAAIQLLRDGDVKAWNIFYKQNTPGMFGPHFAGLDLSGKNLEGVILSGVTLKDVDLSGTVLRKADLTGASLSSVNLNGAILDGAVLNKAKLFICQLKGTSLVGSVLHEASFRTAFFDDCDFTNAEFEDADLELCRIDSSTLHATKFVRTNLLRSQFRSSSATKAVFQRADCRGAIFLHTDFSSADFRNAILRKTTFANVVFDQSTQFHHADVSECRVERYALACLNKDAGGLTVGQRMDMNIVDGVATLREHFGGFRGLIHSLGFLAFVAPYLWFLGRCWFASDALLDKSKKSITIIGALARYVWSGGETWRDGRGFDGWPSWPFYLFVFALAYNTLRLVLLWKTKSLEIKEHVSALPTKFSLIGRWNQVYVATKLGLWVNLVVVAGHTWYFLLRRFLPEDW